MIEILGHEFVFYNDGESSAIIKFCKNYRCSKCNIRATCEALINDSELEEYSDLDKAWVRVRTTCNEQIIRNIIE